MATVWTGAGAGGGNIDGACPVAVDLSSPGELPPLPRIGSPHVATAADAAAADAAAEAAARRRRRRHRRLASGDGEIWTVADAAAAAAAAAAEAVGEGTPGAADSGRLPLSPWASTVRVGLGLDDFATARGYPGASGALASSRSPPASGRPPRSPALALPGQGAGRLGGRRLGDSPPAGLLLPPAAGDDDDGDGRGDNDDDERAGLLPPLPLPPTGSGGVPSARSPRLRRRPGAPSKFLLEEPDGRLDLGVDPVAARAGVRRQRVHESAAAALQRGAGEVHDLMALLDPGVRAGAASPLSGASARGAPRPPPSPPPPHSRGADGAVAAVAGGGGGGGGALRDGDTAVLVDAPPPPSDVSPGRSAGGGGGGANDGIVGGDGEDAFRQYFWRPDMDGLRPMGEHQAAVLARHEAFVRRMVWLLRLFLAVDMASWAAYAVHVARGVLRYGGGGGSAAAAVMSALVRATVSAASTTTVEPAAAAMFLPVPSPHYVWSQLVIPVAMVALDVISWAVAGGTAHTPLLVIVIALIIGDIVTVVSYEQAVLLVRLGLAGVAIQVAGLRSLSRAQAIEFGLEWEREDGVEGYVVVVDAAGTHAAAARLY